MSDTVGGPGPQDRPIGELIHDASEQMSRLVRQEMRLAAVELRQKGSRLGVGAGLVGAAGLLGFYAGAALVACAVLALALVLDAWLAALIVAVAVGLIAGVLGLIGKKQVQQGVPPVPEDAVASVKDDIDAVKEGLHR
jgi:membrane protein